MCLCLSCVVCGGFCLCEVCGVVLAKEFFYFVCAVAGFPAEGSDGCFAVEEVGECFGVCEEFFCTESPDVPVGDLIDCFLFSVAFLEAGDASFVFKAFEYSVPVFLVPSGEYGWFKRLFSDNLVDCDKVFREFVVHFFCP